MGRARLLMLSAAIVLSIACSASAYDTKLTWDGSQSLMQAGGVYWDGYLNGNVLAGAFNMSVQYWASGNIGTGSPVTYSTHTYCMDGVWLVNPDNYWTKVGSLPSINNPAFTAASWGAVVSLNEQFRADSLTSSAKSAGFQLAVWELVNDFGAGTDLTTGGFSLHDGSFGRSGTSFSVGTASYWASQYLAGVGTPSDWALANQVHYQDGQNQLGAIVPEIPTAVLAPMGLAVVGFVRRRVSR